MRRRRFGAIVLIGALMLFGGRARASSGRLDSGGGRGESAQFVLLRGTLGGAFHSIEVWTPRYALTSGFALLAPKAGLVGDFNGDDQVDFADFLVFAGGYGRQRGAADFDDRLDLNRDDRVDFADFLIFASAFDG